MSKRKHKIPVVGCLVSVLGLGICVVPIVMEVRDGGVTRFIDHWRYDRTPDSSLYVGTSTVEDFLEEVSVFDNGVLIHQSNKQIQYIDVDGDDKPDIYAVIPLQNSSAPQQLWLKEALFYDKFGAFVLPPHGIKIMDSKLMLQVEEDYLELRIRGEKHQRNLPVPEVTSHYLWEGLLR